MRETFEFLKECGIFYLATDEDGQPRVRPFGAVDIFEDKLYIQTGRVKPVSRQMKENPRVEICCFKGGKWLRLSGRAVLDPRIEAQEHMLEANPGLKKRYAAGDGNTEVFYLAEATARFCSFTEPEKVVRFG